MVIQKMSELGMSESSASELESSQLSAISESSQPLYANMAEDNSNNANSADMENNIIPVNTRDKS